MTGIVTTYPIDIKRIMEAHEQLCHIFDNSGRRNRPIS